MHFPLGKPLLVMLALAIAGAIAVAVRSSPPRADLEVWAFAPDQVAGWRDLATSYTARTGKTVAIHELSTRAIDTRLLSMMMSRQSGPGVPDLVTIEIGSAGKYFRPPPDEVGLLPLEDYLRRDGLDHAFLPQRLAVWTRGPHLFGLPLDVHPVSLTYRRDLFDQAGVDLAAAKTWPDFQDKCLAFQQYWSSHGRPSRLAAELPEASADVLYMMLLQRGINIVDQQNHVHIDDPKVADTVARYAAMVAGPRRIGQGAGANPAVRVRALVEGDVCAMITPDWSVESLRDWAPELSGELAMMPLPVFDPTDAPTSTWGGTMAGIPRTCAHPDEAWALLKFLAVTPAPAEQTLPAVPANWSLPQFHHPDPFFAGQDIGTLYARLARQLPRRTVTPFTTLAVGQLSRVLHRAVEATQSGAPPDQLRAACTTWLTDARADLERFIRFGEVD